MGLVKRALVVLLACLAVAATPGVVDAQSAADRARARRLFQQADTALEEGRFAEARDLLRRSLAFYPHVATAFNLAVALRGTGEIRASVETFEALVEGRYGEIDDTQREQANELRREAETDVGVLRISVSGAPSIEVRVDGVRIADVQDGGSVEWRVDPGPRVVTASAENRETGEERLDVGRGQTHDVQLSLPLTAAASMGTLVVEASDPGSRVEIVGVAEGQGTLRHRVAPGTYQLVVEGDAGRRESEVDIEGGQTLRVRLDASGGEDIAESPWLWTGLGVGVVALVVVGLILFLPIEEAPVTDPVWNIVTTLSHRF